MLLFGLEEANCRAVARALQQAAAGSSRHSRPQSYNHDCQHPVSWEEDSEPEMRLQPWLIPAQRTQATST